MSAWEKNEECCLEWTGQKRPAYLLLPSLHFASSNSVRKATNIWKLSKFNLHPTNNKK